jgi:hypothetical protein
LKRIAVLDPATSAKEVPDYWSSRSRPEPPRDRYEARLAETLSKIGCEARLAPYVIGSISRTLDYRLTRSGSHVKALAGTFLDEKRCPGSRGLSAGDKSKIGPDKGLRSCEIGWRE